MGAVAGDAATEPAAVFAARTASGRPWCLRPVDAATALAISQRLGLPEIVGRVLAGRGIGVDGAPGFLAPRLRDGLTDPSHLLDLDRAVARLADAVQAGEAVGILGDYDVDGATACALLARYLRGQGVVAAIEIPDRLREGYGPSPPVLARLAAAGCRLVLCLDSGTTAFEALAAARAMGQEVVVVDHHAALDRLPEALAVVNPNRRDQASPMGHLAAVGVTFLLLVGLNRELRLRGRFALRPEPDLRAFLDLVALGTVCDVVPLTGLNRAFVAQGLRQAAQGTNPGLVALAREAGLARVTSAYHLGFVLGPRINAGGRIGRADLGARLLASDDASEAAGLASRLEALNTERRELERRLLAEVEAALVPALAADAPLLLAAGAGWHPGVIGILAARLVERHHRPALVVGLEDGIGRGSGRSVPGFDLGRAVLAARAEGLLLAGGGHAMAAGLTVAAEAVAALERFLLSSMAAALGAGPPPLPALALDGALAVGGCDLGLALTLERLAPFGPGNPEPRFALLDARALRLRAVGQGHLGGVLAGAGGGRVRCIAFRSLETPLGRALMDGAGAPLRLAGRLRADHYQGEARAVFQIEDAALA